MNLLVTGDKGMIGTSLTRALLDAGHVVIGIDKTGQEENKGNYHHVPVDLADLDSLKHIVDQNNIERAIHLAALAHAEGEPDLSWDKYKHVNVDCARNVFEAVENRPLLYISTIDVYGFFDGKKPVSALSAIAPVSNYGKSKALAEEECRKLPHYTIFRFSPVYTDQVKRDIQKRYYLKYPTIAYQIGKGNTYEILNINRAVAEMVQWCNEVPQNNTRILKDEEPMWTPDYIRKERDEGRAKHVLYIPRWLVVLGYLVIKGFLGENEKTYLLNKAVYPLRSCEEH